MSPKLLILLCIWISAANVISQDQFPKTCQIQGSKDVKHPNTLEDFFNSNAASRKGNDGVKMVQSFTKTISDLVTTLFNPLNKHTVQILLKRPIEEYSDGLKQVVEKYDSEYKDAFPYKCYTREQWILLRQLCDKILEQIESTRDIDFSQQRLVIFHLGNRGWEEPLIEDAQMACGVYLFNPSLGTMTEMEESLRNEWKEKIVDRSFIYAQTNQAENLKAFMDRFEWVKESFKDACSQEHDEVICPLSRIFTTVDSMMEDANTYNWNFHMPVPATREFVTVFWLTMPEGIREVYMSASQRQGVARVRINRFMKTTFNNVYVKNVRSLEPLVAHTANLKKRFDEDCKRAINSDEPECDILRVLRQLNALVPLVKEHDDWDNPKIKSLRVVILSSLLATGMVDHVEVSTSQMRSIVEEAFEQFYGYVKENDVKNLWQCMKFLPDTDLISRRAETSCFGDFSGLKAKLPCLFMNLFREVLTYMHTYKGSSLNTKMIRTNTNYQTELANIQLSRISNENDEQTITIQASLADFTNQIKTFVSRDSGRKFAALEKYFTGMADFDERKANADLGFIAGRLKSFTEQVNKLQPTIQDRLTAIAARAKSSTLANTISVGISATAKTIAACNPFDPDPASIIEAADALSQSILQNAKATTVAHLLKVVYQQTNKVAKGLSKNYVFIKEVQKIAKDLPGFIENGVVFEESTNSFLKGYSDYDPQVQKQDLTKVGTDWSAFLAEACDVLYSGGTNAAALFQSSEAAKGDCVSTEGEISKMTEIYSEIYDYQFDMMETLAIAVRAYQSKFFASHLSSKLHTVRPDLQQVSASGSDNRIVDLQEAMINFFLINRMHTLQVVSQYCNYLEFRNAGERPSVCTEAIKTLGHNEISKLMAFKSAKCTPESFNFVNIPTKDVNKKGLKDWIDIKRLYAGESVQFQIPNFEWLVSNDWITESDTEDTAIYLSSFEMFLPSSPSKKASKVARRKHLPRLSRRYRNISAVLSQMDSKMPQDLDLQEIAKQDEASPFRRSPSTSRHVKFSFKAKYAAPLYPSEETVVRYNLQPYRALVFSYQENAQKCRQSPVDNPYPDQPDKICPVAATKVDDDINPSVFSLWKISLQAPKFDAVPSWVDDVSNIKAAVKLCKIKKPSKIEQKKKKTKKRKED